MHGEREREWWVVGEREWLVREWMVRERVVGEGEMVGG